MGVKLGRFSVLVAAALAAIAMAAGARAETDRERARDDEIAELKRQLHVVVNELEGLRTQMAIPDEPTLVSRYGLGPAASKVYGLGQGLSIGGYAEGVYRNQIGDAPGNGNDLADFIRAVLYVGYKFNDRLVFNTEIEFEHASTGKPEGEVSVELAQLDFLIDDGINARAGLLLVPMGFLNEIHEPPFYYGTQRPEPERAIIPSTWRENGAGIFGRIGEDLHYRVYVVNGLDASGFSSAGLRAGRQSGSEAKADDLAVVGRVDWDPLPGMRVGGSYYAGNSGQDSSTVPDTPTNIWEVHGQYERAGLHLRALWTQADLGDALELSAANGTAISSRMIGGYAEVAYDVMPLLFPECDHALEPFFRFEYLDTQNDVPSGVMRDRTQPRRLFIPGLQYRPHPNVVLKLDYRNIDDWGGSSADELSLGFGVAF